MLTGQKVVVATSMPEAFRRIDAIAPDLLAMQTPPPFAGILLKALARNPTERAISMEHIARALA